MPTAELPAWPWEAPTSAPRRDAGLALLLDAGEHLPGIETAGLGADGMGGPLLSVPSRGDVDVTGLLQRATGGDAQAETELFTLLYDDLRRQAQALMHRQARGHTLQATALLHEAYLKVARRRDVKWENRGHFLAVASKAMRSVLVDHARGKGRLKRGKGMERVPLDSLLLPYEDRAGDLLALDDALKRLEAVDERAARVVELRFFGGLTAPDAARVLGVGTRTVEREWEHARTWLHRELGG